MTIDNKQTMAYLDAYEVDGGSDGLCIFDGCVMKKSAQDNYKLPISFCSSNGFNLLPNGDCHISFTSSNDIIKLKTFLGEAYNTKFATEMEQKKRLEMEETALSNTIATQNSMISSQLNQISSVNGQAQVNQNLYNQVQNTNNLLQNDMASLARRLGEVDVKASSIMRMKAATVQNDMYKVWDSYAGKVLTKSFRSPQAGRGMENYTLAYRYVYNASNYVDPYQLWVESSNLNTDKLKDVRFATDDVSYRNNAVIDKLAYNINARYNIVVEVSRASIPLITLFFTHTVTGNMSYREAINSWFRAGNLINWQDHPQLKTTDEFSIAGSGTKSRWVIRRQLSPDTTQYIMTIPYASGSWESRALGRPLVLKDAILDPMVLAKMSDRDVLDRYGGDRISVYTLSTS